MSLDPKDAAAFRDFSALDYPDTSLTPEEQMLVNELEMDEIAEGLAQDKLGGQLNVRKLGMILLR